MVLVDLDHHHTLALLADREAEPLAEWLHEHAGVEMISRDRDSAYAWAAAPGRPTRCKSLTASTCSRTWPR